MKANKNKPLTLTNAEISFYTKFLELILRFSKYKLVCVKSPYNSNPLWVSHLEFIATKKTAQLEKLAEFKIKKINHEILQTPKNKN